MNLSLDLLLAVSSPDDVAKIIEKKKVKEPPILISKRVLPFVDLPKVEHKPIILPKENPEEYSRIGQVQDIEDCTCLRCGNRWQQLGILWDVFSRIENGAVCNTMLPADVRYNVQPDRVMKSKKVVQCLSCFSHDNPNDLPVPGTLEDLLSEK